MTPRPAKTRRRTRTKLTRIVSRRPGPAAEISRAPFSPQRTKRPTIVRSIVFHRAGQKPARRSKRAPHNSKPATRNSRREKRQNLPSTPCIANPSTPRRSNRKARRNFQKGELCRQKQRFATKMLEPFPSTGALEGRGTAHEWPASKLLLQPITGRVPRASPLP
jgi:hypothetical protein